jgi:hypothetical protein
VLECLQLRQRRAGLAGDHDPSMNEHDVARAVFGEMAPAPEGIPVIRSSAAPAVSGEMERLARQRRHDRSPTEHTVWASPRHTRPTGLVALHAVSCTSAFGTVVAEHARAHVVEAAAPRRRGRWREVIAGAVPERVAATVRSDAGALCDAVARELRPLRKAVTTRLAAIRGHVAAERTREIQQSLFDRRAEDAAAHAAAAASRFDMTLARRQASIASPATLEGVAARLVAVWPLRARPALSEVSSREGERDRVEGW